MNWPSGTLPKARSTANRTVLRVLAITPSEVEQKSSSFLVMVKWQYEGELDGMPRTDEQDDMLVFEIAISQGTERRGLGRLVLILTGGNERQWRYYASDAEAFIESVNQDLASHRQYPIQIIYYQDPDWIGLNEYLALVQRDA